MVVVKQPQEKTGSGGGFFSAGSIFFCKLKPEPILRWNKGLYGVNKLHDLQNPIRTFYFSLA